MKIKTTSHTPESKRSWICHKTQHRSTSFCFRKQSQRYKTVILLITGALLLAACTDYQGRKTNCWSKAPIASFAPTECTFTDV